MRFYSGGRLARLSTLPVLTDHNVRCAPVLKSRASQLTGANFQTVSDQASACRRKAPGGRPRAARNMATKALTLS
jgi:hypothetical protein